MGPAVPSLRAQIARWLDRPRLGCRTERSERNRHVRLYCGSRATPPRPNGAPADFPTSRSRSRHAGEVRYGWAKSRSRTESTRSLILRESSDTTKTQWRTGGFPNIAVQISPRRGGALWLVKVQLLRGCAQSVVEIGLFRGSLGVQALEISGSLTLQSGAVVQSAGHFHCLVDCLSDAFSPASLYHTVQVSVIARADGGG